MSAPLTATLFPHAADGITLYQGQQYNLDLFTVILPRYFGEYISASAQNSSGVYVKNFNILRITATAPPGILVISNYGPVRSGTLSGTPTTIGTTNVLLKVELSDYLSTSDSTPETNVVKAVGYITVPITVVAVPTSITPDPSPPVIIPTVVNAVEGTYLSFALSAAIDTYPLYWDATGLPPGLNIEGNTVRGTPTETGTATATLSLRYKPTANAGYITETKTVSIIVTAAPATGDVSTGTSYLGIGGIDVFLDLQSMALSLDLPKAESVISADSKIVNTSTKQFVVKPDQILDLNIRFTKGATLVDPDPASLRFGIGSKIGGALLMIGNTFTKFGTGSSAYFKMRITSDSAEFTALEKDYYDEDAVEQITQTSDTQAGGTEPLDGLCELEFTTGSGSSLATFRSDNLAVLIRRSLLAGI